ncbi:IclR family transcriptional regulator [Parapusillimonas granuli]|uniref:IclR family transcriptional regulator n=1 Tax=Parapusillimonas granuli TaxID=380911 RepID=A0A853FU11_9BURK|nr:IclR family transcriptional regulator [Parapusillimonas granuli]MBB5216506.1 DNA-binding IclR family transcriptional regulator [Parapusillimonas granuli]MEB2399751.1 IclR family transcriptional regulator [Alcaligenaceae bacterium]NYT48188.1 IclR family transcriptional regulator [Parapusillimonas granuli]
MTDIQDNAAPVRSGPRIRPVPAVTRAVAILRLLGRTKEPMNVKSISDELGLVPSTCLHILRALTAEKLLSFDPASKRYRLGAGMLALARGVLETNHFAQLAQPILDDLARRWSVTAIGVEVVDLSQMVVTALSRSKLPFRLHVDVGSRFPGLISATGRLVAAFSQHSLKEIQAQFASLRWQQPLSFEDWWREVEASRAQGYSFDQGNYIAGITLIAVPVLDAQAHITHTIVVASIVNQLSEAETQDLIRELKTHAANLSRQLFSLE